MTLLSPLPESDVTTEGVDCSRNEFLHHHPVLGAARWPELDAGRICRYQPTARILAHVADRFRCDLDQLRVHNGAESALTTIFAAVARMPGATLLLPEPGWDFHDSLAQRFRIRTESYRYVDQGDAYAVDLPALSRRVDALEHPVLLLVSPSNPLGSRVPDETLIVLAEQVAGKGLTIVDQAYFGFANASNLDWSVGELLQAVPATVLVRTLSKYYGIPGLRVGFTAAAPGVHAMLGIEAGYLGFNVFADEFAVACLESHDQFERIAATVVRLREALAAGLSEFPGFRAFHSDANFLLVRTPGAAYAPWLADHGVRVRTFSSELAECVRITVPPEPHVRRILDATKSFVAGGRAHRPAVTVVEQVAPCTRS